MGAEQSFWVEIAIPNNRAVGSVTTANGQEWIFRAQDGFDLRTRANELRGAFARAMSTARDNQDLFDDPDSEAYQQLKHAAACGARLFRDFFAEVRHPSDDVGVDRHDELTALFLSEEGRDIRVLETQFDPHLPWQLLYVRPVHSGELDLSGFLGIRHLVCTTFAGGGAVAVLSEKACGLALYGDLDGMLKECETVRALAGTRKIDVHIFDKVASSERHRAAEKLQRKWEEVTPQLLHVATHGRHGSIFELDEAGGVTHRAVTPGIVVAENAAIEGERLQQMVRNDVCGLAFFNCCSSARHYLGSDGGLARDILRAEATSVIAAEIEIGNRTAALFAEQFYTHLLGGKCSRESYRHARNSLMSSHAYDTMSVLAYTHMSRRVAGISWAA